MKNDRRAIGVFDSGLGGISVLKDLKKRMPHENFIYYGDCAYAPYGPREKEDITNRCVTICDFMSGKDVKMIIIACNTATSASADHLRSMYADIPIVGMEPALKVAAEGKKNKRIIVMATELTLKEAKFEKLMQNYQDDHEIIKLPCPELVEIIERGELTNDDYVTKQLHHYFQAYDMHKINSIVLGCTHFVFFKDKIHNLLGSHIEIVDGNDGTCRNVEHILTERNQLNHDSGDGIIEFFNSSDDDIYLERTNKLFHTTD